MSKIKQLINSAISITAEGQPNQVNLKELRRALVLISDTIDLMKIQLADKKAKPRGKAKS